MAYLSLKTEEEVLEYIGIMINDLKLDYVTPLLKDMAQNERNFTFVSEKFSGNDEIAMRIACQIRDYNRAISKINKIKENLALRPKLSSEELVYIKLPAEMQEEIYAIASVLLMPALKYGYAEAAADLLKIMKDRELVGANSTNGPLNFKVRCALERIVAIYGKRFQIEKKTHIKNANHDFINAIFAGKFGEQKGLTVEHMQKIFNNPEPTLALFAFPKPHKTTKSCAEKAVNAMVHE